MEKEKEQKEKQLLISRHQPRPSYVKYDLKLFYYLIKIKKYLN